MPRVFGWLHEHSLRLNKMLIIVIVKGYTSGLIQLKDRSLVVMLIKC